MQRIIEVLISPTGEVSIQTKGYAGADCLQASKWLEEALGVVRSEQKTAERYQVGEARQQVNAVKASVDQTEARNGESLFHIRQCRTDARRSDASASLLFPGWLDR